MKQFFRDFFTFNKRERNGIFVLLTIILILLIWLNTSHYFFENEQIDFNQFENQIAALNSSIKRGQDSLNQIKASKHFSFNTKETKETKQAERFDFNPNNLSEINWKRLGLTEKQIKMIKNYENKGGKFRKKEDVKKMYCISNDLYTSLEPYISIPEDKKTVKDTLHFIKSEKPIVEVSLIELNAADSATLTTIKGIGAFFAKTIIKYRNLLGGFYNKKQLLEVWKFDSTKYVGIEKYVSVDALQVKKININHCTAKELKHPYLNWNMVNAIIAYRTIHGFFKSIEDIQKTDLVDHETFQKIAPYLITQ